MNLINLYPNGEYKVTILAGANGSGKSKLLDMFAKECDFQKYVESYTNGIDRRNDILKFCELIDKIVIDNIELYLDCDAQEDLLSDIFNINPEISIVCSTHSPMIISQGWSDKVIQIEDFK